MHKGCTALEHCNDRNAIVERNVAYRTGIWERRDGCRD